MRKHSLLHRKITSSAFTVLFFTFVSYSQLCMELHSSVITAQGWKNYSPLPCSGLRQQCLHGHDLYLLCSMMVLAQSYSGSLTEGRGLAAEFEQRKRETEQNGQPCNALMSCHAIRFRQIISLDHLSCHDITERFICTPLCGLIADDLRLSS